MPFILRIIAQRILLLVLSSAAVVGINEQTNVLENLPDPLPEIHQEDFTSFPIPQTNILDLPEKLTEDLPKIKTTDKPIIKLPEITITPQPTSEPKKDPVFNSPIFTEPEEKEITKETEIQTESSSIDNLLVNILCIRQIGNRINVTNGSGVIISSSGVVLTNAHVAQHFLLKDAGYKCSLRRENIPLYGFNAVPLYISENWIENNYKQLTSSSPTGTGKYDYALLLITGNTNPVIPLPKFPFVKLGTESKFLDTGDSMTVAGYPAQNTGSLELAKNNSLAKDVVKVKDIFTLGSNTVDVVSSDDTNVAQRGSSGGGAFKNNELGGIIVSTNNGSGPGKFVVNILTLSYINREIRNETGKNIYEFLSGDLIKQSEDFVSVGQRLEQLLMRSF